ncbi:hypothetical protein Q9189_002452 [Teloschistes chrysophthalmus]
MDTVPEESIVEANSVDIEANSLLTQSTAASGPRPSKDSRASIERLAAIRSTTIDSYRSEPSPTRRIADPETIQKVEAVVDKIIRGFKDQDESISIVLKTKPRSSITTSLSSQAPSPRTQYQLSFPGNTPQEAWRFSTAELAKTVRRRTAAMLTCHPAVVLRILELIHEALVNNVVVSKRNIYYKDPELFKSQKVVDRYVDILSYTFGIQRQALNVVSPPASSIPQQKDSSREISPLPITTARRVHGMDIKMYKYIVFVKKHAMLIDRLDEIRTIDISGVNWVLVVEKEVLRPCLVDDAFLNCHNAHEYSKAGKGIILTAKGYPDVSTRGFLRLLSISSHPSPSIFALVDFDPDGIAIMSTYKHGSAALSHESDNLRVPFVRWLGVKSIDLTAIKRNTESYDDRNGLLQLSMRDRKKAVKMLDQELCAEDGVEQEWRGELQVMLMLNMKGEMEMLSQLEGGIELWVEDRICAETLRSRRFGNDPLPLPRDDPELHG